MALPSPDLYNNWQEFAQALVTELQRSHGVSGDDVTVNQEAVLGQNIYDPTQTYIIQEGHVFNSRVAVNGNILPDWNFAITYENQSFGDFNSGDFWTEGGSVTIDSGGENTSPSFQFGTGTNSVTSTYFIPVFPTEVLFFSWRFNLATGYDGTLTLDVEYYDINQTLLGTATVSTASGTADTWTATENFSYTVPTTAQYLKVKLTSTSATAGSARVNWAWVSRTEIRATENTGALADLDTVGSTEIDDDAVTTSKLADLAVEAAKLAGSSVTATKIANLAVGTAAIADLAVTNAKINDLNADKITAGTVATARLDLDGISLVNNAGTLEIGTVNTSDLADGSVTNIKVGSLDASKITTGTLSATRINIDGITLTNNAGTLEIGTADWTTNIGGSGKPDDDATRNTLFRQTTAPTANGTGDMWYDTDDELLYRWSGSAWVLFAPAGGDTATTVSDSGSGTFTASATIVRGGGNTHIDVLGRVSGTAASGTASPWPATITLRRGGSGGTIIRTWTGIIGNYEDNGVDPANAAGSGGGTYIDTNTGTGSTQYHATMSLQNGFYTEAIDITATQTYYT